MNISEETNTVNHLLLKIVEQYNNENPSSMYILYHPKLNEYVLYGKSSQGNNSSTYTFRCKTEDALETFISFVICKNSYLTFTLYVINYGVDYEYNHEKLSYNILNSTVNYSNEIKSYDKLRYNKDRYLTILRMLKNIRNF
jgi:hypothetical protein